MDDDYENLPDPFANVDVNWEQLLAPSPPIPHKRKAPVTPDSRKKRKKIELEDELTCPICFDLFVATQILRCGHSHCAPCIWPWITSHKMCPLCRAPSGPLNMTPNLGIDNIVETYVGTLADDDTGWQDGGQKLAEFRQRQRKWKDAVAERKQRVVPPIVFVLVDSDEEY